MPWFEGSIRDAVATAKNRRAIFVVFVEGTDEASRSTSEVLKSGEIGERLQSEDFIVIKIESGGESFRQFSQIYHLVPVPSVFFIGNNGVPLEVVAGDVRATDLLRRIEDVVSRSGTPQASSTNLIAEERHSNRPLQDEAAAMPVKTPTQVVTTVTPATPEAEEAGKVPGGAPACAAGAAAPSDSPAGAPAATAEAGASGSAQAASIEERLQRARELIEAKKLQKKEDEEREARNRELERRRVGQEVQKQRRQQMEQEALQAAEQIKKERLAEQEARQRVLQQIAQDKAERAARQNKVKEEEDTKRAQEEARRRDIQAAARAADGARIQFRLPDGSTHTHVFEAGTPLADVRAYASANLQLPFRDFGMSMTFPRREFSAEDNTRTVTELQLCPTAVILILPARRGEVVSQPGYGSSLVDWLWTLLTPLLSLYAYIRGLIAPDDPPATPRPSAHAPPPEAAAQPAAGARGTDGSSVRQRGAALSESAAIRRQGNIHRLSNRQDSSDDENNTWNGNSTQQM